MHLINLFTENYVITVNQIKMIIKEAEQLFPQKKKTTAFFMSGCLPTSSQEGAKWITIRPAQVID